MSLIFWKGVLEMVERLLNIPPLVLLLAISYLVGAILGYFLGEWF